MRVIEGLVRFDRQEWKDAKVLLWLYLAQRI